MDKIPLVYTGHSRDLVKHLRCPACQYVIPDATVVAKAMSILGRRSTITPEKARDMQALGAAAKRRKRDAKK